MQLYEANFKSELSAQVVLGAWGTARFLLSYFDSFTHLAKRDPPPAPKEGPVVGLGLLFSPTHKRTEGRAPVWGSEFTSKRRRTTGGIKQKPL